MTEYEITQTKNRTDRPFLTARVSGMCVQVYWTVLQGRDRNVYALTHVTAFVGASMEHLQFSPSMFRVTPTLTEWRRIDAAPALWSDAGTMHDLMSFNQSLAKQRNVLDVVITDALVALYTTGTEMAADMLLDMLSIDVRDPMQCLRIMADAAKRKESE